MPLTPQQRIAWKNRCNEGADNSLKRQQAQRKKPRSSNLGAFLIFKTKTGGFRMKDLATIITLATEYPVITFTTLILVAIIYYKPLIEAIIRSALLNR